MSATVSTGGLVDGFRYHDKGNLATIGRARAVAEVKHIRLSGFLAWIIWLTVLLWYLVGFENRLLVVTRWAFSFIAHRRGARVITNTAMRSTTGAPASVASCQRSLPSGTLKARRLPESDAQARHLDLTNSLAEHLPMNPRPFTGAIMQTKLLPLIESPPRNTRPLGKRQRLTIGTMYVGLALTVVALIVVYVDHATANKLADHIRTGYPTYSQARIDTAVTTYLVYLSVIGALGIITWLGTIWALKASKRWARAVATAMFALGTGIALFDLLIKDTSGETGLPHLLGWAGMLPFLAGLLAVTLLWRNPDRHSGRHSAGSPTDDRAVAVGGLARANPADAGSAGWEQKDRRRGSTYPCRASATSHECR